MHTESVFSVNKMVMTRDFFLKLSLFMNNFLLKDTTNQKLDTDTCGGKGSRDRKARVGRITT
jgi:hypothetical protein